MSVPAVPNIPGVHRLSKAEAMEDLDYILQSTPSDAKIAALAATDKRSAAAAAAAKRKAAKDGRR